MTGDARPLPPMNDGAGQSSIWLEPPTVPNGSHSCGRAGTSTAVRRTTNSWSKRLSPFSKWQENFLLQRPLLHRR
jgi:hypothetical protein